MASDSERSGTINIVLPRTMRGQWRLVELLANGNTIDPGNARKQWWAISEAAELPWCLYSLLRRQKQEEPMGRGFGNRGINIASRTHPHSARQDVDADRLQTRVARILVSKRAVTQVHHARGHSAVQFHYRSGVQVSDRKLG